MGDSLKPKGWPCVVRKDPFTIFKKDHETPEGQLFREQTRFANNSTADERPIPFKNRPYGCLLYEFQQARTCPFNDIDEENKYWAIQETRNRRCKCFPTCNCSLNFPCAACMGPAAWNQTVEPQARIHTHIRPPAPRKRSEAGSWSSCIVNSNGYVSGDPSRPPNVSKVDQPVVYPNTITPWGPNAKSLASTPEHYKYVPNYEEYFDHQNIDSTTLRPDDRNFDLTAAMLRKYPTKRFANEPFFPHEERAVEKVFPAVPSKRPTNPYTNFVNSIFYY